MNITPQGFSKHERLKHRKAIQQLFAAHQSLFSFPLKCIFRIHTEQMGERPPIRATVSASKKKFPRAVDRNQLKRQIRETFRLTKMKWYDHLPKGKQMDILFIYVAKDKCSYDQIQNAMNRLVKKWNSL